MASLEGRDYLWHKTSSRPNVWRVEDGRIADNPVSVDFAAVMAQLGVDVFNGKGWETYDNGEAVPPRPES